MAEHDDDPSRLGSFSTLAVANPDIDSLLQIACQEIHDALDVSHVKAMEYLPDERALLIRAGIGWREHVVGEHRLSAGFESAAGLTLQTGIPTIANDLASEERFHVPQLLIDHGVRSAVNCLIKADDYVFGVLEADSDKPRHFDDKDVQTLQGFANIVALVVAQATLAKEKMELSRKIELSFKEFAHRTKNNNQMLISIVSLQKSKAQILEVTHALDEVLARISVLNAIDGLLSFVDEAEQVDASYYVTSLAGKIFSGLSGSSPQVRLVTDLQPGVLGRAQAQALAIIINEFITNSFKYAFKDRGGVLTIRIQFHDDTAEIDLIDDGPGVADDATDGLGMQIIKAMARQIDAEAEWQKGETPGARLRLTIPTRIPVARSAS
ncbi:MAG: GAF domain-containing protein [Rhodospirillales bacterium]